MLIRRAHGIYFRIIFRNSRVLHSLCYQCSLYYCLIYSSFALSGLILVLANIQELFLTPLPLLLKTVFIICSINMNVMFQFQFNTARGYQSSEMLLSLSMELETCMEKAVEVPISITSRESLS